MKRIEMIDKIHDLLEFQSRFGTSFRFKAVEILELIEKAGMAPPEAEFTDPDWELEYMKREWET